MAFNIKNCIAVIVAYPDMMVAPELLEFFHGIGMNTQQIRYHKEGRDICCAYNVSCKIALKSKANFFFFADNDIRPQRPDCEPFILKKGYDITSIKYPTGIEDSWNDERSFHCGLWKCSRKVLEAIKPPYFLWPRTTDGCDYEACPSAYLAGKAHDIGLTTGHLGYAEHIVKHGAGC